MSSLLVTTYEAPKRHIGCRICVGHAEDTNGTWQVGFPVYFIKFNLGTHQADACLKLDTVGDTIVVSL